MSKHNKERRIIRKSLKAGLQPRDLSPYAQVRVLKHGKKNLKGLVPADFVIPVPEYPRKEQWTMADLRRGQKWND